MGTRPVRIVRSACLLLTMFILSCVMQPLEETSFEPDWVRTGSGAAQTEQGRFFYGVGTAAGLQSRILLRATADNLAREELAKVIDRFMRALTLDQRAGPDSPGGPVSFHTLIQNVLRDATIVDHWTDPRDGRLYALCRLDLDAIKENLARDRELEMALRNAMLSRADQVHAQMTAHRFQEK